MSTYYIIAHDNYGARAEFRSLAEAQRTIRSCGEDFATTTLQEHNYIEVTTYRLHHDHDSGRPLAIDAASDRAAKGAARRALRAAGFRVDTTFRPHNWEKDGGVQGWNLGRHEGCATAVLVRQRVKETR